MDAYKRPQETPVYTVCLKKGYRIFTLISGSLLLGLALVTAVLSAMTCETVGQGVVCGLIFLFSAGMGAKTLRSLWVRAEVFHDGQIRYYGLFRMRQYHISQIAASNTQAESYWVRDDDGISADYWDRVTTFMDADGKTLLHFGMAYQNVDRLQKSVKNSQKAAARLDKKKKSRKKSHKSN